MKLDKYVQKELKRRQREQESDGDTKVFKTDILKELAKASKVSLLTLQNAERGGKISTYMKAKAISEATGGQVTVKDLCE